MPPALTPDLAVAYVRELSADVRAVAVLDAEGALLAGEAGVARAAAPLLATGAEVEAVTACGVVCAARDERHAVVAACGRFAVPGIVRSDLRAVLAALRGAAPPPGAPAPQPTGEHGGERLRAAAEAVISAAQRAPGA